MVQEVSLRSVNHNLLPILRALLRERSVTRAAERIGLTQPAASAALARLRLMLNDPLLVKVGRGMEISPRGEDLLPQVEDLCIRLERLWTNPEFQPRTSDRCFNITCPDYVQIMLAPHLIEVISREAPGMSLRFLDVPIDDVLRHKVVDIDVILAIRQSLTHPAMSDFTVESLYQDHIVAVVGSGHRLFHVSHVKRADYEADKFLVFVGGAQYLEKRYDELRNAIRAPVTATAFSQHYSALLMIAAQSDCVALIPNRLARLAAGILGLRILDSKYSEFEIDVCVAWDRRFESDHAHRWLLAQIRSAATLINRTT